MNHTTLGKIVAISVVAALTIGVAIVGTSRAMALTLNAGGYSITADPKGTSISGPNNFNLATQVPELPVIPQLPGQEPPK